MRRMQKFGRGGILPFLFFFMVSYSSGQVVFLGSMFQEKKVEQGEIVYIEFSLVNPKERDVEIDLLVKDYVLTDKGMSILEANTVIRSNADWIQVKHPRMLLGAGKKIALRVPVRVPDNPGLRGSYYSILLIEMMLPVQVVRAGKRLDVALRYAIQVITTIEGGRRAVKFEQVEVAGENKNVLQVGVENNGDEFLELVLKTEQEGVESKRFRIFPGCKRQLSLGLESLEDGEYSTRLFLDDGETLLIPLRIKLRKGEVEEPLPLLSVGERIDKKRRGKHYLKLWLVLSTGSFRRGLSVSGNASFDSLRLGSGYRRFWMLDDRIYESQYMSLGLKVWKLSFSQYVYRFENQTMLNSGLRLSLKDMSLNLGFISSKASRVINLNFSVQLPWGNHRLQGYLYMMRKRKGFSVSYSIPITIYF